MTCDENDTVRDVKIGGENSWYMLGHVFWSEEFSRKFLEILLRDYDKPETADLLWESIYINNINSLEMKIRKYKDGVIFEFDTLDELREFDESYVNDTRSHIIKEIAKSLFCEEKDITELSAYKDESNAAAGFTFRCKNKRYSYAYCEKTLKEKQ